MSFAARGLLDYVLRLPDNFRITKEFLISSSPMGKSGITTLLDELERFGYKRTVNVFDKKTRRPAKFMIFYESSYLLVPKSEKKNKSQ